ncbi:MAG: hypothetical protein Q9M39_09765 [Sulfurovum sp.]|nr:hypothetical protein [Sulfurovum sp.]
MTIIMNEEFMNKALKRVDELQNELIEQSKKVSNSEKIVSIKVDCFIEEYTERKNNLNSCIPKYSVI